MRALTKSGLLLLALAAPAALHAQVAWDSPLLLPPRPGPGFGIFLVDVDAGGLGVLGTWRPGTWNYGLRLGIAEAAGNNDLAVYGGLDYVSALHTSNSSFPLDVDWQFGAGASISDMVRLSVPLGLSLGHTFDAQGAAFVPYFGPRVVLDALFGDDLPGDGNDDLDLDLGVDVGIDIRFSGGGALGGRTIRFGGTLGDRDGIGIGIVF